jgi:hypothetical protein
LAIIDELVTRLGFEIRGQQNLNRYERSLAGAERSARSFATRFMAIGSAVTIASTAIVNGLQRFVAPIAADLDQLNKAADRVGVGVEALQELRFSAAQMAGVAEGQVDMAMQRFSRRIGEAANDSGELKGIIEELGIELRNSDGSLRSSESLLGDFADAVQNAESEQEALRIAFKMFDSEGAAMVNMLREGSEGIDGMRQSFRDLGLVMSDDDLDIGTRFVDAADKIRRVSENLRQRIALYVLPIFTDWYDRTLDFWRDLEASGRVERGLEIAGNAIAGLLNGIATGAGLVWDFGRAFYGVADAVVSATASLTGLSKAQAALGIMAGGAATTMAGRSAIKWLAARFPIVAAAIAVEDIMSGLRGDDSVIGSTEAGLQALENLRSAMGEFESALGSLRGALDSLDLNIDWGILSDPDAFIQQALVDFVNDLANAIRSLSDAINSFSSGNILDGIRDLGVDFNVDDIGFGAVGAIRRRFSGNNGTQDRISSGFSDAQQPRSTGILELQQMMQNLSGNMARLAPQAAVDATITDARVSQDQRTFPMETSVTVNQTVTQPASAPGATAQAVGNAAANAVTAQRARIAATPTTSGNGPQ